MKKIYFAILILITCSTACNNPSTDNGNAPATTENTAKDNTPATTANQPEGMALMSKSDCGTCHNTTAKIVGPSYKDIAAKYPDTPENVSKLADEIIKGSSGIWGSVPMPAHTSLQKADVEKMTGYILSLK